VGRVLSSLVGAGPYDVLYADPPWLYYGSPTKDQAAGKHYPCMLTSEIKALPVKSVRASKSVLLCWATSTKIPDALEVMDSWGFFYRGVFQVWVKSSQGGNIIHGQGTRPSFTKPTAEYLLIGATTPRGRTLPIKSEAMPNVVLAPRPGNKHSAKPEVFRTHIETLFGQDLRKIELFARTEAPGWDSWGNELIPT
jgi:N6-adenosine-specific RNA methylase IME4